MLPFAGLIRWFRHDVLKLTMLRFYALALALVAGVVYVPYVGNPLVFDDFNVVNGTDFLDYAFSFYPAPRWLTYATLAHTYALTAGSISAMRWGNLILHAFTVIAVFVLLRETCIAALDKGLNDKARASKATFIALVAAAIFAVHPIAVYGVGYLVQRTIIMATLFMLLMLIAYLRWLMTGRTGPWLWSAAWYFLSVFCKEHAVMAPAVALLMTLLLHPPSPALVRRLIPPFAVYAIIAVLVISMIKGVLGAAYEPLAIDMMKGMRLDHELAQGGYLLSLRTQLFLFFKYWFLWAVPNVDWMSVDMREPFSHSFLAWPYMPAALMFVCYPVLAVGMVLRGGAIGVVGWVMAWPWLMFATELSTVRIQEPFVLYRAYLWFPVAGALVALALSRVNIRIASLSVLVATCVLVPLSWNRLHTLSDTLEMWEDAAKLLVRGDEPGAGRIYYNRALALSSKGRKIEALADLDRAVKLHPRFASLYYARARTKFDLRRYGDAMDDLDTAIALDPKSSVFFYARSITLKQLGLDHEARQSLRKSCDMKYLIACLALQRGETKGTLVPH